MKILSINDASIYQAIEIPDIKIYKISELTNCTIPPMFVLFNHELFTFDEFPYSNEEVNWAVYCAHDGGELIYDFINHKIVSCTNSIEQKRQQFHEGTLSSGSRSSSDK